MAQPSDSRLEARLALVREHVRLENAHDLEGILETFGEAAAYEDRAWGDEYPGAEGIRSYYEQLLEASADLRIDIEKEHVSETAVVLEVVIRGTHTGRWRGLPSTARAFEFPLCAVYTFDDDDRLAGERIYYDRATVLKQMGVHREPVGFVGRAALLLNHPLTLAQALVRNAGLAAGRAWKQVFSSRRDSPDEDPRPYVG
ncbi:MAG: ester cyclase [Gemmatimonadetes bacterium]|nr:ester cyclase [Gemmatimonadota bacterium]